MIVSSLWNIHDQSQYAQVKQKQPFSSPVQSVCCVLTFLHVPKLCIPGLCWPLLWCRQVSSAEGWAECSRTSLPAMIYRCAGRSHWIQSVPCKCTLFLIKMDHPGNSAPFFCSYLLQVVESRTEGRELIRLILQCTADISRASFKSGQTVSACCSS